MLNEPSLFWCLFWFVGHPLAGLLPPQKLSSLFWCLFWFVGLPSAGLLPPQKLSSLFWYLFWFVGLPSAGLLPLKNSLVTFGVSFGLYVCLWHNFSLLKNSSLFLYLFWFVGLFGRFPPSSKILLPVSFGVSFGF